MQALNAMLSIWKQLERMQDISEHLIIWLGFDQVTLPNIGYYETSMCTLIMQEATIASDFKK